MLTPPEVESKQLLAITVEPGKDSRLKVKNKNIIYEKDGLLINQCSLSRILHLLIIGDFSITTVLIRELNDHGISVCLLKNNLTAYAYFGFESQANFLVRRQQYTMGEDHNFSIAKDIVVDKIRNQNMLLQRINILHKTLLSTIPDVECAEDAKVLLGIEGMASKLFFNDYFATYGWVSRSPRTKDDIINYLLDIGYTVLFNFVDAICRHFGLDTYKGVYHRQFFARRSLVCDLMEPFRCLIDNRTHTALALHIFTTNLFKVGSHGVYTEWKDSSKITQIYAQEIMDNRQSIFLYVQGFYKHVMAQNNVMAHFRLKK